MLFNKFYILLAVYILYPFDFCDSGKQIISDSLQVIKVIAFKGNDKIPYTADKPDHFICRLYALNILRKKVYLIVVYLEPGYFIDRKNHQKYNDNEDCAGLLEKQVRNQS